MPAAGTRTAPAVESSLAATPKPDSAKKDAALESDNIASSADVTAFLQLLPFNASWCVGRVSDTLTLALILTRSQPGRVRPLGLHARQKGPLHPHRAAPLGVASPLLASDPRPNRMGAPPTLKGPAQPACQL
jgi:hypothetical protein